MKRMYVFILLIVSVCVKSWSMLQASKNDKDFRGFDDTIIFKIVWPGILDTPDNSQVKESIEVMTTLKEKYECDLPELRPNQTTTIEDYVGPSPINLLKPLFLQKVCSYKVDSYWSYEVCHGRYIRQYHEEREVKPVKAQEFLLGVWNNEEQWRLDDTWKSPRTVKVEGQLLPYVGMTMDSGTNCDLNGKPRLTRVLYVCYAYGRHEVYSLKETSTCEYEIIVLSPLLCQHPQFKPKEHDENIINCVPIGDAPKRPRKMLMSEVESLKFQNKGLNLMIDDKQASDDVLAVWKIEKVIKDGETHLKFELHPVTGEEGVVDDSVNQDKSSPITDDSPVRAFLNGENCLNGGTGWWKYEFCYGKHVLQYHVDRSGETTTLLLGKFDEQTHIDWIKENKGKAPKPLDKRNSVSHFYAGGDICDKTGKPRQTEVKLRCPENTSNLAQVSLYLLEPRTCHYILGVESPLICEILQFADKDGLIRSLPPVDETQDMPNAGGSVIKQKDVNKFGLD